MQAELAEEEAEGTEDKKQDQNDGQEESKCNVALHIHFMKQQETGVRRTNLNLRHDWNGMDLNHLPMRPF